MNFLWGIFPGLFNSATILRDQGPSSIITTSIQFQITIVINHSTNWLRNLDSSVNVWLRFCARMSHRKIEEIHSGWELNRAIGDQYKTQPSCCFTFDFPIQLLAVTTVSLYCLSSGSMIITVFHSMKGKSFFSYRPSKHHWPWSHLPVSVSLWETGLGLVKIHLQMKQIGQVTIG